MRALPPRRPCAVVLTSVVALALVAGTGPSAGAAPAASHASSAGRAAPADATTVVAVAGAGQSFGGPATLTTAAGTSLLSYYRQGPGVARALELQRQVGTGTWAPVALSQGGLDTFGVPALVEDAATGRVLLTASAQASADVAGTLGTYLWWSADQGVTWSAPVRVWNSFGVGDAAPDGAGGFWTTVGETDALIAHVPADYSMQATPSGATRLTDKLGSRGATGLVTAGPARTPVLGFFTTAGIYAHRGATYDPALDTQVFGAGSLGTLLGVAGDTTGAALATSHTPSYAASGTTALWVRGFDPTTGAVGAEHRLSTGQALFFQLRSLPSAGGLAAIWRDNGDSDLYVARASGGADGTWSTSRVIDDEADAVSYYSHLDVSAGWAVGLGNRDSDSTAVVWAAEASPQTIDPTLASKGRAAYSSKKGTLTIRSTVNTPGRLKAVATITAPGRRPTRVTKSVRAKGFGTYTTRVRLPKAARALLRSVPKARIRLTVTFASSAGTVKVRPNVRA
ncbi:exo-alpha-sialidase [Nocardioides oleivorans]|uniref:Exo-alpha-sialidase n=1 Tax=Nocardioides oleivorans TaxID=273676 RepID=A0A4Q2RZE5_9ACTN|nr:sialidase family protein [Nocardioides oleivorans]RYB94508.1 exo-alpha-sialidase [Nocardioides oleivorans]